MTGKMIFWREECLAEVVHIMDMVVLKVPTFFLIDSYISNTNTKLASPKLK